MGVVNAFMDKENPNKNKRRGREGYKQFFEYDSTRFTIWERVGTYYQAPRHLREDVIAAMVKNQQRGREMINEKKTAQHFYAADGKRQYFGERINFNFLISASIR